MAGSSWCEHEGITYLFVEYTGISGSRASIAVLHGSVAMIESTPGPVRMLVDVAHCDLGNDFFREAKRVARAVYVPRQTTAYLYGLPTFAVLVLSGMHRLGQGREARPFTSRDAALAALVADSVAGR